jgi:hypothetical protein
MIKSFLISFAAASLVSVAAQAGTLKVPNTEAPVVFVTIPDSWHPEAVDDGAAGMSDDGGDVKILAFNKGVDDALKNTYDSLESFSVRLDPSSKKVTKVKINGMEGEEILFQGKEELGKHVTPVSVTIVVLPVKGKVVVLTHYVDTEGAKKSKEVIDKIINSLKPAP